MFTQYIIGPHDHNGVSRYFISDHQKFETITQFYLIYKTYNVVQYIVNIFFSINQFTMTEYSMKYIEEKYRKILYCINKHGTYYYTNVHI